MGNSRWVPLLVAAVLAAAATSAAAQQQAAAYKIGYVNTERVMRDSRVSQLAQKSLESEFAKREKEIAAGPANVAARRRSELVDDMTRRRDEAMKQIADRANGIIRRIAEAEKLDAVFFEAVYADPRVDLTARVTKELDASR